MNKYSQSELNLVLKKLGLNRGDTVYFHSCLLSLGKLVEAISKEDLCQRIVDVIINIIGTEGTIVVPTFTTETARYGRPFDLENTACDTGVLAEFIRTKESSIRSLHPINSVTAYGVNADLICSNVAKSNYGLDSPYDRMRSLGTKCVNLGMDFLSNSWYHYLESIYCVPHIYNKLLDIPVFSNQKPCKDNFFASLRYLNANIVYNLNHFDHELLKNKFIKVEKLAAGSVSCVDVETYCKVGLNLLKLNPYAFLESTPKFNPGEFPLK